MPPMRPPIFGPPRGPGFIRGSAPPQFNTRGLFGPPMPRRGIPFGAASAPKQGGGFLASLFGRGGGSGLAQGAGTAAKAAGGGSTLTNFMNSTQKVLAAGERVVPMVRQVQQYGPLIKNLPSMWKIYRGLNATTAEDQEEAIDQVDLNILESSNHIESSASLKSSKKEKNDSSEIDYSHELPGSTIIKSKPQNVKPSLPKLFI
ncbi:VrrA/YqfQ family protein [Bacillus sp. FJAT-27986]|uniref:VrrA/YqfQ family protein n=1 Tax=Bacillus sp. FJAT-27986 TaxID=1743146 RepID=UPI00080AD4E8|nr:VrrA/YqfQ family protein [Bacillus sp. FJAT-27986]OCA86420.1 hypothetical protein A8L44_08430 [Bacillus sp. FJAT-27986]